ncbi:MAG: GTPase [Chloroflexota bacterium]
MDIHGLPMFLIDTAGLGETDDPIEQLGIARSTEALRQAGIVVLVMDIGSPPDAADRAAVAALARHAPRTPFLLVLNKCDLAAREPAAPFIALLDRESALDSRSRPVRIVECAAATGWGLDALEDLLAETALAGQTLDVEDTVVDNARQRQALEEAVRSLIAAETGLRAARPPELACIDLRAALESLGAVTGRNVSESVLDRIFHDFCIGK